MIFSISTILAMAFSMRCHCHPAPDCMPVLCGWRYRAGFVFLHSLLRFVSGWQKRCEALSLTHLWSMYHLVHTLVHLFPCFLFSSITSLDFSNLCIANESFVASFYRAAFILLRNLRYFKYFSQIEWQFTLRIWQSLQQRLTGSVIILTSSLVL